MRGTASRPSKRKSAKIRRKQTKTLPKHRLLRLRPCWYPAEDGRPPVPVMGGALPPCESESDVIREENGVKTVVQTVYFAAGSGSGSGSYTTSYTTSFRSSGSGSGGSYVFGSCVYTVGGYGLELI